MSLYYIFCVISKKKKINKFDYVFTLDNFLGITLHTTRWPLLCRGGIKKIII
jgi:hypothetical protein